MSQVTPLCAPSAAMTAAAPADVPTLLSIRDGGSDVNATCSAEGVPTSTPQCHGRHCADDGLIVFIGDPPEAFPGVEDDDAEPVRDTLAASTVAGFCLALWVTLLLVPLNVYLQQRATTADDVRPFRLRATVIVGALLTALLGFCEVFVTPCSLAGCGFGSFRTDCVPIPPLRHQLRRCLHAAFGNIFGIALGAAVVAAVIRCAAVVGRFGAASQLMGAAVSLAHATAADHPLCVLLSSVTAGFLFAEAMSCSTPGGTIRFVPVFCTAVVVVLFDLRLGLVDTTLTSAVLTLNSLKPLTSPPAPSILLNGPLAIMGNIAGAVLARVVAECVTPAAKPSSVAKALSFL